MRWVSQPLIARRPGVETARWETWEMQALLEGTRREPRLQENEASETAPARESLDAVRERLDTLAEEETDRAVP